MSEGERRVEGERAASGAPPEEELQRALEELRRVGEEMGKALDESIKRLQRALEELAPKPEGGGAGGE